jgi:hypothetical protein
MGMIVREKDASENLITASFPRVEDASATRIYFAQEMWVCLSCGLAEARVPAAKLEVLRQRKSAAS